MLKTKLIKARKLRNISQSDVATYLKISQTQYQKRESGKVKIVMDEWKKISKLLDLSIEEIFEEQIDILNKKTLKEELDSLKERIKILEAKLI